MKSSQPPMEARTTPVTIGAYARIQPDAAGEIRVRLSQLEGVALFDLDDPGKVGLWIEDQDLDRAHEKLTQEIMRVPGVLGVWPVYVDLDSFEAGALPASAPASSPSLNPTVPLKKQA